MTWQRLAPGACWLFCFCSGVQKLSLSLQTRLRIYTDDVERAYSQQEVQCQLCYVFQMENGIGCGVL